MNYFIIPCNQSNNKILNNNLHDTSNVTWVRPNILDKNKETLLINLLNEYNYCLNKKSVQEPLEIHNIYGMPYDYYLLPLKELKQKYYNIKNQYYNTTQLSWKDIMKIRRRIKNKNYARKSRHINKHKNINLKKNNEELKNNNMELKGFLNIYENLFYENLKI